MKVSELLHAAERGEIIYFWFPMGEAAEGIGHGIWLRAEPGSLVSGIKGLFGPDGLLLVKGGAGCWYVHEYIGNMGGGNCKAMESGGTGGA